MLTFDISLIVTILLMAVRLTVVLVMTPVLMAASVPRMVRIVLVISVAAMLAIGFPQWRLAEVPDAGALVEAVCSEVALGAAMATGIFVAFGAFSVAGRLLDIQIGYGLGQVFDPVTRQQLPILTTIFNQIAVVIFFVSDMHHALLRGLTFSFERFPPGRAWSLELAAAPVLKHAASLFTLGFALAAPVVFCLLLIELALGVLSRSLPQMNMFALGIPLKILAGLIALSIWFLLATGVMTRTYASIFQTWEAVFQ